MGDGCQSLLLVQSDVVVQEFLDRACMTALRGTVTDKVDVVAPFGEMPQGDDRLAYFGVFRHRVGEVLLV